MKSIGETCIKEDSWVNNEASFMNLDCDDEISSHQANNEDFPDSARYKKKLKRMSGSVKSDSEESEEVSSDQTNYMQSSNTEDNFKPILDKPIIKAIKKDMKK